jgi:hypothetical protein
MSVESSPKRGFDMRRVVILASMLVAIALATPPSGAATATSQRARDRAVEIYASVIRRLVTVDHTGGDPAFSVIYLVDGPVPDVANPTQAFDELEPSRPFSPKLLARLKASLDDLPELAVIDDASTVVTGEAPGHVINDGVLVRVGPIPKGRTRVEVGASSWINGLAGQWLTYVVERTKDGWEVTGTTGPVSIS